MPLARGGSIESLLRGGARKHATAAHGLRAAAELVLERLWPASRLFKELHRLEASHSCSGPLIIVFTESVASHLQLILLMLLLIIYEDPRSLEISAIFLIVRASFSEFG